MTLVIQRDYEEITPAFNAAIMRINSDQTAQPNFLYEVSIEDDESSFSQIFTLPKPYDGTDIKFDVNKVARSLMANELQETGSSAIAAGWKRIPDIKKVNVVVTELYGSPQTRHDTQSFNHQAWNACLKNLVYRKYDKEDLIFIAATDNSNVLSSGVNEDVSPNHSTFLSLINYNDGLFVRAQIICYDADDNIISDSNIDLPASSPTDYTQSYIALDVGIRSLTLIDSSLVTGSYPILASTAAYYKVNVVWDNGVDTMVRLFKTFTVKCSPVFPVYAIQYHSRNGYFDTAVFDKLSLVSSSVEKKEFGLSEYFQAESNNFNSDYLDVNKITGVLETELFKLNTKPLSEDEITKYSEIISSDKIYLDLGEDGLLEVILIDNNYELLKNYNKKQKILTLTFKSAIKETRQY